MRGILACVNENVYEPSDDTELLMEILDIPREEKVMEVGVGTGVISAFLSTKGSYVIASDINPYAVRASLCTAQLNSVYFDLVNGNLDTFLRFPIDNIVFNAPYLPVEEYKDWIGFSWSGGLTGNDVLITLLSAKRAKTYYVTFSSLGDEELLYHTLDKLNLKVQRLKSIKIGLEEIFAAKLVKVG